MISIFSIEAARTDSSFDCNIKSPVCARVGNVHCSLYKQSLWIITNVLLRQTITGLHLKKRRVFLTAMFRVDHEGGPH